jgi:hypothetical protein
MDKSFLQDLILSDEDFLWSYSRLKQYDDCKYAWFLKYIEGLEEEDLFFSSYGSYLHDIYSEILLGNLDKNEAVHHYLINFTRKVNNSAPSKEVYSSYFLDGVNAMKNVDEFLSQINNTKSQINNYEVAGVELPVSFSIDGSNFTGYIDLLIKNEEGDYVIVDHKSRKLKPRSAKGNLKSDLILDNYFKQLYLYAIAIKEMYGKYPKELWLHCFRDNKIIKEEFDEEKLAEAKSWATDTIKTICQTQSWTPNCDWFSCTNLCGLHNECDYYKMMKY